jgi:hypothetical protein
MPKKLSRQRKHQIANVANGMCMRHAKRPAVIGKLCVECREKARTREREKRGWNPVAVPREKWPTIDLSKGADAISEEFGCSKSTVFKQMKTRGWRKVWLGPHQEITNKPTEP